ncbi:DUF2332 domain-containing protein [Sinisalibacter aestuarii]|uniref:DUF2332 family protein n=1 Tax=Sinisalibacter aestuarii TaxID=2949426 RepID=A0ABQ5LXW7_9RHOB|nr:DUF2332 family protein [Sinisalibacter aestuarii]GKY88942.1 hypothetical protein STA1M1_28110 [Sinisalibacter aestuarii]
MTLSDAFLDQARSNRSLGSPFTARVLTLLADRLAPGNPVVDRMNDWPGDIGNRGASLALRLLGGLHWLVLAGDCPDLAACYPPNPRPDDATLIAALDRALAEHQPTLMRALDYPPQTNEVRRAAVMIATAHWLAEQFGISRFIASELGAAAGLNLMWDKYRLDLACGVFGPRSSAVRLDPEWRGPCPPDAEIEVIDRRGADLHPIDPHDPDDALRLTSYLWPDQPWRIERARAAMALAGATVDKADAGDWLAERLATLHPGTIHLVTHTVAWQYFGEETYTKCTAAFDAAGARATDDAPLARLSMEGDDRKGEGAPIILTIWPGGHVIKLGRVDFHGRWVDWNAPAHLPGKPRKKLKPKE